MNARRVVVSLVASVAVAGLVGAGLAPSASADGSSEHHGQKRAFRAHLNGYQEVPSVSTPARGWFRARLSPDGESLEYVLAYTGLSGTVIFSHIHLGRARTNGGVSVFLCQTGAGPDPTGLAPTCPQEGMVRGVITADNVIGPGGQGVAAGELDELVRALQARATYVNLHTTAFPPGEIRGDIR